MYTRKHTPACMHTKAGTLYRFFNLNKQWPINPKLFMSPICAAVLSPLYAAVHVTTLCGTLSTSHARCHHSVNISCTMSPLCAAHCQHLISLEPSISSQLEEAQYLHAYWKIPSQLTLPEPSTSQPPILWCLHQTSLKIQHGFLLSGSAIVRKCVCVCVCVCV